jgi:DNA-binding GntR family transcriptional regulator
MDTPSTSEDIAYGKLKQAILLGELPENEFLSQRMLAERVGVAVVTARAAMRRLESEGLLENVPRWGVRIPLESVETVTDRYFVREVLEVAALRRLLERMDPDHISLLRSAAEACDRAVLDDPDNVALFAELHFQFHYQLAAASESPLLLSELDRLNLRSRMLNHAKRGRRRATARAHHVQDVNDLLCGDPVKAEATLREHIRRGLAIELAALPTTS